MQAAKEEQNKFKAKLRETISENPERKNQIQ